MWKSTLNESSTLIGERGFRRILFIPEMNTKYVFYQLSKGVTII